MPHIVTLQDISAHGAQCAVRDSDDATTGQNAIHQARAFKDAAGLTGIILTKLDGTARGGVVLAIKEELGVPVKYIGVGEKIEDLQPFNPKAFAAALFENSDKVGDFDIHFGEEDENEQDGDGDEDE